MIKIKGKYNEAVVYASIIEDIAKAQIKTICDLAVFKGSKIRIMPDVHAGAGCTIGTTMTLNGTVIPNLVGVDIGCGMEVAQIKEKEINFEKLDTLIKEEIPYGKEVRKQIHPFASEFNIKELKCIKNVEQLNMETKAIGSLGGGNHFIEVDKDEQGNLYIVIHSGSRHLGKEVAQYYQRKAYEQMHKIDQDEINKIVNAYKKEGKQFEIEAKLKELKENKNKDISKDLAYCTGTLFDDYIHDMKIMQKYADLNRKVMMQIIVEGMGLNVVDQFTTIHNYIDTENMILRKGAVSAQKDEKLLIPINMRDGSLICIGKGNAEYNYSAPHGAGRLMSRSKAFETLDVNEFKKQMKGIYTTTATINTLDESPMAYKTMDDIVKNIGPTAQIIKIIKPVYNFKAEK